MKISLGAAAENERKNRIVFLDGLRGIAVVAVVIFHIWNNAGLTEVEKSCPRLINAAFMTCGNGVEIFFVISGFVIAYSVRHARVTPGYLLNYALRRSVRSIRSVCPI